MRVLVLGGNRYVGKRLATLFQVNGYEVTLFNRGNFKDEKNINIKRIESCKSQVHKALEGHIFDLVVDQISMSGEDVERNLKALGPQKIHYILTSTLAVYDQDTMVKEEEFNPLKYTEKKRRNKLRKI